MIDTPKQAISWTGFTKRHNHAGHLIGTAELTDASGITLPGLTLQIEVKAAVDVARCLYLFSIMQLNNKKRIRLYQLEVAPRDKKTHNGNIEIYGSHEHTAPDIEPTAIATSDVDCNNWATTLQWFFTRVSIVPFFIGDPYGDIELSMG